MLSGLHEHLILPESLENGLMVLQDTNKLEIMGNDFGTGFDILDHCGPLQFKGE